MSGEQKVELIFDFNEDAIAATGGAVVESFAPICGFFFRGFLHLHCLLLVIGRVLLHLGGALIWSGQTQHLIVVALWPVAGTEGK